MKTFYTLLFLVLFSFGAYAHEHYPLECCHDRDCAPIIEVKPLEKSMFPTKFLVRTKQAWSVWDTKTLKANTLPSGKSHFLNDGKYHACIIGLDSSKMYMGVPKGRLMCMFNPTGG